MRLFEKRSKGGQSIVGTGLAPVLKVEAICKVQRPTQRERRQVFDIPPKRVVVIEHQAEQKVCPHCQAVTCASKPSGVSAPVKSRPAFGAIAVYLTQQQFLPYERACETIQDLIGPAMTVGTIKNMVQRCADALAP